MKDKILLRKQQGQAIVEMCVCLIPILVILLGMIFISGLGISNIRAFIKAKGNAEILSRTNDAVGGSGESIHHWDYGTPEQGGDGYPFTADDRVVNFSEAAASSGTGAFCDLLLNDSVGSESSSKDDNSRYNFRPVALLNVKNNFAQNVPETMLAAAELVQGRADSDLRKIFTIDPNYFSANEVRSFKFSFTNLFGIDIDDIDLRTMRANTVYYPALPNE
jgi:hypothetical protein